MIHRFGIQPVPHFLDLVGKRLQQKPHVHLIARFAPGHERRHLAAHQGEHVQGVYFPLFGVADVDEDSLAAQVEVAGGVLVTCSSYLK